MMNELYNVSSSPHVRNRLTTGKAMYQVILSLKQDTIFGINRFGTVEFLVLSGKFPKTDLKQNYPPKTSNQPI